MTYLGIDYGQRRIGLAKAESETKIATPLYTISNTKDIFDYLKKIVETEGIDEIVVGVPVSFDGEEHEFAKETREFGEKLSEKLKKKVYFQNEMLTTKQAERHGVGDIDASAAALILQGFLDKG